MSHPFRDLVKVRRGLKRLAAQIRLVQDDLAFAHDGGSTIYASDYFDLHRYLFRTEGIQAVDVGFHPARPELARQQLLLALAYLFQSETHGGPVYLLPPHAAELASRLRHAGERFAERVSLRATARSLFNSMSPDDRALIRIVGTGQSLNLAQMADLMRLVRRRFGEICRAASENVDATEALSRLRPLVRNKRLSSNANEILERYGLRPIEPHFISPEATAAVFEAMRASDKPTDADPSSILTASERAAVDTPLSKLLDAEALLWLREINRRLPQNTRMLLITSDIGIHAAAERLRHEPWFEWKDVASHVRSVEMCLLHLTLQGTDKYESRCEWTDETSSVLATIADQSLLTHGTTDLGRSLEKSRRQLTNRAGGIWQQHLNLRLAGAVPKEPWLRDGFLLSRSTSTSQPPIRPDRKNALDLLRDFWTFTFSEVYQKEVAEHDAASLQELVAQALRIIILRILGPEDSGDALDLFTNHLSNQRLVGVLREDAGAMVTALRFQSDEYRKETDTLAATRGDRGNLVSTLRSTLLHASTRIAASGTEDSEGELFIAFVISMFGLWLPAHRLSTRAAESSNPAYRREALYFAAVTARNVGISESPVNLTWLKRSYDLITSAMETNGTSEDDPRFLAERAWVTLQFGNEVRHTRSSLDEHEALQSRNISDAVRDLQRALDGTNERWLRVNVLLALCVACSYLPDGVERADEHLAELRREIEGDPCNTFSADYYQLKYVAAIVASRKAQQRGDANVLDTAVQELQSVLRDHGQKLSVYERSIIERSIKSIADKT